MNGKTHKTLAVLSSVVYASAKINMVQHPAVTAGAIVCAYFGGLVPDIDKRTSSISKKVPVTSFVVETVCGHRGVVHTPFVGLALYTVLLFILTIKQLDILYVHLINAFFIGYSSHLILDAMTPKGIMMFFPITTKYFSLLKLKGRYRDLFIRMIGYALFVSGFYFGVLTI